MNGMKTSDQPGDCRRGAQGAGTSRRRPCNYFELGVSLFRDAKAAPGLIYRRDDGSMGGSILRWGQKRRLKVCRVARLLSSDGQSTMQLSTSSRPERTAGAQGSQQETALQELAHHAAKRTGSMRAIFEGATAGTSIVNRIAGHGYSARGFTGLTASTVFARLVTPTGRTMSSRWIPVFCCCHQKCRGDHLMALARVSRVFRDTQIINKLRGTEDAAGLCILTGGPARRMRPEQRQCTVMGSSSLAMAFARRPVC
jgi:hypothetical protein